MLPNELSHLYDWSPASQHSYGEFLRAKQRDGTTRFGIDNHDKELIATDQQLSARGIKVLSVNQERGFTLLSTAAEREGAADRAGKLNWGFSECLVSQGQMNLPLEELVKLSSTAAHAWACEQFELGRDEFRRKLSKEALQSTMRAIEGQGNHAGVKSEFRFHFLVGIIRLGSYHNASSELVNPGLAQQAFLAAARYADSTYPEDAGLSLICAGRAALLEGEMDNAVAYTRKGLDLLPNHAAGLYQLGRALFLKGSRQEASNRLVDAIFLNVEHALHATGDPDFVGKMDFLSDVLRQAHERYAARYRQYAERFRRARQALLDFSFMEMPADALQLKGLAEIKETPKLSEALAETKTLFAYSAAIDKLLAGYRLFPASFEEFKAHCIRQLQAKILRPPRREDFLHPGQPESAQGGNHPSRAWLASGIVCGIATFLVESCQASRPVYRGIFESMSDLFLIPLVFAVGIGGTVALIEDIYREYVRSKYKSALAAFDAACYTYNNLKDSLDNEIATINGMSLPVECALPVTADAGQQATPADSSPTKKHVSAWSKLK